MKQMEKIKQNKNISKDKYVIKICSNIDHFGVGQNIREKGETDDMCLCTCRNVVWNYIFCSLFVINKKISITHVTEKTQWTKRCRSSKDIYWFLLPTHLPCTLWLKPTGHRVLGLHLKEPSVFTHSKPSPQLWVLCAHSLMSVGEERV